MSTDDLTKLLEGQAEADSPGYKNLGVSRLVRSMSKRPDNLYGKWCGSCQGIWFGIAGESECPRCGSRRGGWRR